MIRRFRHKGLAELWSLGRTARINKTFSERILRRLDRLDAVTEPEGMNLPGFDFHALKGKPQRYSVHVNGPWCITFAFAGENADQVDFEQYH